MNISNNPDPIKIILVENEVGTLVLSRKADYGFRFLVKNGGKASKDVKAQNTALIGEGVGEEVSALLSIRGTFLNLDSDDSRKEVVKIKLDQASKLLVKRYLQRILLLGNLVKENKITRNRALKIRDFLEGGLKAAALYNFYNSELQRLIINDPKFEGAADLIRNSDYKSGKFDINEYTSVEQYTTLIKEAMYKIELTNQARYASRSEKQVHTIHNLSVLVGELLESSVVDDVIDELVVKLTDFDISVIRFAALYSAEIMEFALLLNIVVDEDSVSEELYDFDDFEEN